MKSTERGSTLDTSLDINPPTRREKNIKITPQKTMSANRAAKNILRKLLTY
jgi:hypothetical protein